MKLAASKRPAWVPVSNQAIPRPKSSTLSFPRFKYSSLTDPDISLLSSDEIQVMDDTINKLSHFYSEEISKYSHGDIPWRLAKDGETLNYEAVFYRDPEYSVREYDD